MRNPVRQLMDGKILILTSSPQEEELLDKFFLCYDYSILLTGRNGGILAESNNLCDRSIYFVMNYGTTRKIYLTPEEGEEEIFEIVHELDVRYAKDVPIISGFEFYDRAMDFIKSLKKGTLVTIMGEESYSFYDAEHIVKLTEDVPVKDLDKISKEQIKKLGKKRQLPQVSGEIVGGGSGGTYAIKPRKFWVVELLE